ncbi:hypothetical protein ACSSS7_006392 [Eimeria intestinalis]
MAQVAAAHALVALPHPPAAPAAAAAAAAGPAAAAACNEGGGGNGGFGQTRKITHISDHYEIGKKLGSG